MEVEYKGTDYKGNPRQETQRVAEFLYDEILYAIRDWNSSREKIRLEDQPKLVIEAMGRLVEKLLEKNVLNLDDLKYISQCDYGMKADSLVLKKEE
jgi:hypothetical protein